MNIIRRFKIVSIISVMLLSFLLSACGSKNELKDLEDYTLKLKRLKLGIHQKSVKDEVPTPKAVTYQASKLREPFQTLDSVATNKENLQSPLQGYPINMLRFVGTLSEGSVVSAYVLTPDNMVYQVKAGDVIGNRYGKIIAITPNQVQIEEGADKSNSQIITLQLKEDN